MSIHIRNDGCDWRNGSIWYVLRRNKTKKHLFQNVDAVLSDSWGFLIRSMIVRIHFTHRWPGDGSAITYSDMTANGIYKDPTQTQTHTHAHTPTYTRALHISFLRFCIENLNYLLSINLSILRYCAGVLVYGRVTVYLTICDCNCALLLHILPFAYQFNFNIITNLCMNMPVCLEGSLSLCNSLVFIIQWIPFCELLNDFWCDAWCIWDYSHQFVHCLILLGNCISNFDLRFLRESMFKHFSLELWEDKLLRDIKNSTSKIDKSLRIMYSSQTNLV